MAAQTYSANMVAREVTKRGVRCDAKRVRAWARANMTRFDDDAYTSHAYSSAERTRIVAALIARSKPDAKGTAGRASSAARGRAGRPKTTRKPATATKSTPATATPDPVAS